MIAKLVLYHLNCTSSPPEIKILNKKLSRGLLSNIMACLLDLGILAISNYLCAKKKSSEVVILAGRVLFCIFISTQRLTSFGRDDTENLHLAKDSKSKPAFTVNIFSM